MMGNFLVVALLLEDCRCRRLGECEGGRRIASTCSLNLMDFFRWCGGMSVRAQVLVPKLWPT